MTSIDEGDALDRRIFLKRLAISGAAVMAACSRGAMSSAGGNASAAPTTASLRDRIGLQLFTVRDVTATDYPGTLMRVAQVGYREVQTTGSYGSYTAAQIHQFLDAAKLVSPATHVSPRMGPDFERTLEGYQLIGHKYTTVAFGITPRGAPSTAAAPTSVPAGPPATKRETRDAVRRTADRLNKAGAITKKYGIKVIVHNHTEEFEPLADSSQRPYDVLLAETDPALVAMELDIGWATVAGENALDLFRRSPGRFEVWHVKDCSNLTSLTASMDQPARHRTAKIVPIGEGQIDFKPIFAQAQLAGMRHFFVEQDSAPASGDSVGDAAKSYRSLARILA